MLPEDYTVTKLNVKYNKFYKQNHNGNITVLSFKQKCKLSEIQQITNDISKDLKKNMKDNDDIEINVSVGIKFTFGYKSSLRLTKLGDKTELWNPFEYDPDEDLITKYNDPNALVSFDMYLLVINKSGGCSNKNNDCFYDCIKILTNGILPDKINHPAKMKKFFEIERTDKIPYDSIKMNELEKLLKNCNLNIGGDATYISNQETKQYNYILNLKGGHYTIKQDDTRIKLGYQRIKEAKPMIYLKKKNHVIIFDGKLKEISYIEFDKILHGYDYILLPMKRGTDNFEEIYNIFIKNADALKKATENNVHKINLYKTGTTKNTVYNLFMKMTQGITEPDEINEFEGKMLKNAMGGGLQFNQSYEGKAYKYDYVSRYSSIMCSNKCIPMKEGKFITFTQDDMDILINKKHTPKYGIFECIIYKNNNARDKLFYFNKNNVYTHDDITRSIKLNLRIEIINKPNNAIIYDKTDLMPMTRIFGDYIQYIFKLKKDEVPLSKNLSNLLWGVLSQKNKITKVIKPDDQHIKIDENLSPYQFKKFEDGTFQITFSNDSKPFVTNWARLGCFLTSFARNKLSAFLEPRFDDVVWVHTDGFMLKNKLVTDYEFSNDLHAMKYEGHITDIKIKNMRPFGLHDFKI